MGGKGGKASQPGRGAERCWEEKRDDLRGEGLRGERGERISWEKILGRKREKISGGKGLRGERGEGSGQGKGGGKILGRKREKISGGERP